MGSEMCIRDSPIADGWHPYFDLQAPVDNCALQIKTGVVLELNDDLIPTGNMNRDTRFGTFSSLSGIQLDDVFLLDTQGAQPKVSIHNNDGLQVNLYPDSSYPFLVAYTPPHRRTIALENVSAAPDAFNNNMGLVLMPMGTEKYFTTIYEIKTS